MKRAHALLVAIAFVSGCVSPPEQPEAPSEESPATAKPEPVTPAPVARKPAPPPQTIAPPAMADAPRHSEVEMLVNEFARLRRLAPPELAREQEAARHAFNQLRTDASRVRYAMATSIPGAPGSDEGRALDLLDPLVKTPGATLHPLAVLLASYIHEQRRLAAQLAGLQQNVQVLQQNVNGLQQKLDAITKLERSLTGRGEGGAVRRR